MNNTRKIYFSNILLILFVLPGIMRLSHALASHSDIFHSHSHHHHHTCCDSDHNAGFHYNQTHHHNCLLEYVQLATFENTAEPVIPAGEINSVYFYKPEINSILSIAIYNVSLLRAPPLTV